MYSYSDHGFLTVALTVNWERSLRSCTSARFLSCIEFWAVWCLFWSGFAFPLQADVTEPEGTEIEAAADDVESLQGRMRTILSAPEFRRVRINIEQHEWAKPKKKASEKPKPEETAAGKPFNPNFSAAQPFMQMVGNGLTGLVWVMIAVVCVVMLYLILRAVTGRDRTATHTGEEKPGFDQGEAPPAPGEFTGDYYTREAQKLAAAGHYREAIGQLVLGLMGHTERAGLIRFRSGLTHRDYLRAQQPRPTLRETFRNIVRLYEPICFGRRPAHADDFEQSLAQYQAVLSDA